MKPPTPVTLPVLFRADRENGVLWITAVFPTEAHNCFDPGTFTIYQHVGQHGAATRGWYNRTRRATPAEYADLLTELTSIYGNTHGGTEDPVRLVVRQRMTRAHDRARAEQIKIMRTAGGR